MKKPILVIVVLFVVIGVLVGVRSVVSTRITTSGLELGEIQDKTKAFKTENAILEEKIFSFSSLTRVFETASKVGFVQSKESFAVTAANPIARGQ